MNRTHRISQRTEVSYYANSTRKKRLPAAHEESSQSSKTPKEGTPSATGLGILLNATRDEDREERQVRALEFIAHFLDRIELQLERVADAIELAMLED